MYDNFNVYTIVSLMNIDTLPHEKIRKLLQSNTIMSLKQLHLELGKRHRSSLFRDLKKLNLVTSYTHAGQYHALKSAVRFDAQGLWFFNQSGFSKQGTLNDTLIHFISNAETGMTQKELKSLLHIKVQNTLTHLIKSKKIGRHYLPDHVYVYLSVDKLKAEEQLQKRLTLHDNVIDISLPAENLIIEILLELIRTSGCQAEAKELGELLRKRDVAIGDAAIVYVLAYYDIKKN